MKPEFTRIAVDIPGSEGPVFDLNGTFFMVCPNRGQILNVTEDGVITEVANTGGIPAGLQCDRDNHIWIADMKLGIFRMASDGTLDHVVSEYDGAPIRGCNDCAFDSQGNLYVTAPGGSGPDNPVGEVYCRRADGDVVRLDAGFQFCNGIAVSADDRTLIVAETFTKALWAYDITAPGEITNKRLWAKEPGDLSGGPDGMDFDETGHLLATHWGSGRIEVFNPYGTLVDRIETPFEKPSNVHFGGPDGQWVYVTEHDTDGLWKFHWIRKGQPQYCERGRS